MPSRVLTARSTSRDGTNTLAPASVSALTVSRPIPEYPPVTSATFPERSRPAITSLASGLLLKPVSMGCCCSEILIGPLIFEFLCMPIQTLGVSTARTFLPFLRHALLHFSWHSFQHFSSRFLQGDGCLPFSSPTRKQLRQWLLCQSVSM